MKPYINAYWSDPESWPLNPRGWVLFAKALQRLGPLIEPSWEGFELGEIHAAALPAWPAEGEPDRHALSKALTIHVIADPTTAATEAISRGTPAPPRRPHPPRPSLAHYPHGQDWTPPPPEPPPPPPPTRPLPTLREAYEAALVLDRAYLEGSATRAARAAKVRRYITEALLQGDLVGGYRSEYGSVLELPEEWWNTEDVTERFETGGIFPSDPFRRHRSNLERGRFAPLYVTIDSLNAFASQFSSPPPTEVPAWWPGPEARVTQWCRDDANEEAARVRLRNKGHPGPSVAAVCRELAEMWNEARPDAPTTGKSVETMRGTKK